MISKIDLYTLTVPGVAFTFQRTRKTCVYFFHSVLSLVHIKLFPCFSLTFQLCSGIFFLKLNYCFHLLIHGKTYYMDLAFQVGLVKGRKIQLNIQIFCQFTFHPSFQLAYFPFGQLCFYLAVLLAAFDKECVKSMLL